MLAIISQLKKYLRFSRSDENKAMIDVAFHTMITLYRPKLIPRFWIVQVHICDRMSYPHISMRLNER